MSASPFQIIIRGIRDNPAVTEVNVRSGPNTSYALLFKIPVGTSGLTVINARPDDQNANFEGRIYVWLQATFPNGQQGWVRDDLVDVQGDGTRFGYGVVSQPTPAFSIARSMNVGMASPISPPDPARSSTPASASSPAPSGTAQNKPPTSAADSTPVQTGDLNRVRRAAFNITSAFEGGGYATYQTYDSGIISYGRFQFTLAAGSFVTVINRFLERSKSPVTDGLRAYLPRFNAKDESLRQDAQLKALCIEAAKDPAMQQVQDEVATEGFWDTVIDLSIKPRNIQSPLGYALLFDMSIQHGRFNHLVPKAEEVLGVPNKSRLGENGITEQTFIAKLAELRRDNLYALADKLKLPGMRPRGDFWVNLVGANDWALMGDAAGTVNVNGKIVQVRNP